MSEHPEDHWGLAITSEPEMVQRVMDFLRKESLTDPVCHWLYTLMIIEEVPLLNILFALAQVKTDLAKQAQDKLMDFIHCNPISSVIMGKSL